MTESSRFWDTGSYTDENFSECLNRLFGDGVLSGVTNELAVTASNPAAMSIVVGTGEAWNHGSWYQNDAAKTMSITAADPSNPRIDLVILRRTASSNTCVLAVLTGTPAGSPSAPSLTQTAATWEYTLARIAVGAGVTSIVAGNITDSRPIQSLHTPSNIVAYFNGAVASIPHGWTEATTIRGRYIVGVPSGGTVAGTVGTALTNSENRAVGEHLHTVTVTDPGHFHADALWSAGANLVNSAASATGDSAKSTGSKTTGITAVTTNTGTVAGTNAPFIQLVAVTKT